MRQLIGLLVVALVWLAFCGCAAEPPRPLHADVLAKAGLQYYWMRQLQLNQGETIEQLYVLDENLYCLTDKHRLIAVDAAVGLEKWSYTVPGAATTIFAPCHADKVSMSEKAAGIISPTKPEDLKTFDVVIINTLSCALVLDRATGKLYREIPFDFAANTAGASDGQCFYVGSTRGWYYAIQLQEAVKAWWLATEDMMSVPVKYHDGVLYVADTGGHFVATQTGQRGRKRWSRDLRGSVTAEFHVDQRGCFVPCDDNRLYAFGLDGGKKLWDLPFVCQGPLRDAVQVAENTIFQFASRDKFYAINLATGKERWAMPEGRKVLAIFDGEVYLLNSSNTLLIVDEVLGTIKTSLPMTGWDLFWPNTSMPAVYVATRSGDLACIRKASAGRLTPEVLRQRA